MKKKELKRDYLRRILALKREDAGYKDMDTCMREYNKFMKSLNYGEVRSEEIEKIFCDFYKKGLTVSNIVAKQKGQETLLKELKEFLEKALKYYEEVLYPQYYNNTKGQSPKDVMIEMADRKRINSVTGAIADVDRFISELGEKWNEFTEYLYKIIDFAFSGKYSKETGPDCLRIDEFDLVVDEEIAYYKKHIASYNQSEYGNTDCFYTGVNDNPYKNLFLYCLNSYIKNYYEIDIPDIALGKFFDLKKFDNIIFKDKYSLMDIAEIYSYMTGRECKKSYGKIKQQFRKSESMQEYKIAGKYEFKEPSIPLATYAYYRKKNHVEPPIDKLFQRYNPLISYVYAPLLHTMMHGDNMKIKAYTKFREFIVTEYKRLLSNVDDGYQDTFLELLLQCPMRLYYRGVGIDVDSVCR